MKVIETNGKIDDKVNLILEHPLEIEIPTNVRVIIVLPEDSETAEIESDKIEETDLEKAMAIYKKGSKKYKNSLR